MRFSFFLDILFPPRCLSCRAFLSRDEGLCAACATTIPVHRSFFCGVCRARLPSPIARCHRAALFTLGAATDYDVEAVRRIIHETKFECVKSGAELLGHLVAHYLDLWAPIPADIIIPVPLSRRRLKERGFNQSEIIARVLASRTGIPQEMLALTKTKNTVPQSSLRGNELREENIRGCFAVTENAIVRGKRVLLVDDVATSGATLTEAARTLTCAGAKKIIAVTAAIAR